MLFSTSCATAVVANPITQAASSSMQLSSTMIPSSSTQSVMGITSYQAQHGSGSFQATSSATTNSAMNISTIFGPPLGVMTGLPLPIISNSGHGVSQPWNSQSGRGIILKTKLTVISMVLFPRDVCQLLDIGN
jgi:hypothetical protein